MRAYWIFFLRVNLINFIVSLGMTFNNIIMLPVMLCTFGMGFGFLGYYYFYKNELYLYYNLGLTKLKLGIMTLVINAIIALPLFILLILLS